MQEYVSALERKAAASWDMIKSRYPVILNLHVVKQDEVKEEFLRQMNGLRSAEEIRLHFALEPTDANLVFEELLQLQAIRFLSNTEYLAYLKRGRQELHKRHRALQDQENRLRGEKICLARQIQELTALTRFRQQEIPRLQEALSEIAGHIAMHKAKAQRLWIFNAKLFGQAKSMQARMTKIRVELNSLEGDMSEHQMN